jgi:hypothetical protein
MRSYFWWYAEQAVFGLMQAMRQLGNRTKSTDGAMDELLARTFLRIVNGSRNPMNFSTRAAHDRNHDSG